MFKDSWVIYAILSAFFAALTSILAKIGISDINSNLATAIRTIVVYFRELPQVFLGYSTTKHFNSVMRQK